jgi:HAD superfamily hydrolase (TIGR01509 family)
VLENLPERLAGPIHNGRASIVFDCDGTLIDSERTHSVALQTVLDSLRIDIPLKTLQERFGGIDNQSIVQQLQVEYGRRIPGNLEAQLDSATYELLSLAEPMPWTIEVLTALAEKDVVLSVASNSTYRNVEVMLSQTGLLGFFNGRIATRDQVAAAKPAPDVHLLAAKLSNSVPAACMSLEDAPTGIVAARAAGMTVVGYRPADSVYTSIELQKAGAAHIINDLRLLLSGDFAAEHTHGGATPRGTER